MPRDVHEQRIEEVLRLVDLWERRRDLVRTFSGGMKRRLEIARGLIHYPKVLVLDEPTIGLDPQTRAYLWEYILKLKRERNMTIFMTTHYMDEAEYCDRIAVVDHGKIIALGSPAELKKQVGGESIAIVSRHPGLKELVESAYGRPVTQDGDELDLRVDDAEAFMPRLLRRPRGHPDRADRHQAADHRGRVPLAHRSHHQAG